jgi:hypothetical protein
MPYYVGRDYNLTKFEILICLKQRWSLIRKRFADSNYILLRS